MVIKNHDDLLQLEGYGKIYDKWFHNHTDRRKYADYLKEEYGLTYFNNRNSKYCNEIHFESEADYLLFLIKWG